ncbi:MAG: ABC transporter permease [Anaerolineales bacterium]|jgi:oligopeptide transport system permease protein|nr:ABC transporter permease [Chloroflexota bacterium]MBK6645820.1 ABC transporter permease [Anaerolineales bacterium]MCC6985304.1 ABC transporter permease [Anaerolineales bacterium]
MTAHPAVSQTIASFGEATKAKTPNQEAIERLMRNKASVMGFFVILLFILVAIFARVLSPHDPLEITSGQKYLPPMWIKETPGGKASNPDYPLGTDSLGRDVLSRVIFGARVSMVVGFVPTLVIVVIGTLVGMVAGYLGGRWDNLLMRLTDVIYAFPDLLFFIIVMVSLRDSWLGQFMNGMFLLFISLAVVNWVGVARLVRGQVLSLKQKEFIEAARAIGVRTPRIMTHHLLPNTLGVIIVLIAFRVPGLIITEAILGYLGLGLRPPANSDSMFVTSWGGLLLEGQSAINAQPWILLGPAICIALVVLAFTFLGDGLRDALDPRMRGTK